ncbi:MAG: response regulator [Deltaproteobacteria bacterium RBG_19FT_COMBO_46_9]|nr:MAG: response regulator [Deltaproteobacteria bacterium RBG_19FT_COMBO_46_9]
MAEEFNVLVVDDEDDFRETLVKRLKIRSLNVWGAASGQKALDLMDEMVFDVVVLDVKMPGLDGIETLREMKKKKPLTEVILLTGHASIESGIEGIKLGAFDYMMKPVNIDELLDKMRQAFERKVIHEEQP